MGNCVTPTKNKERRRSGGQVKPSDDEERGSAGNGQAKADPRGADAGKRKEEHRVDEPSRVDHQRPPADTRQPGPAAHGKEPAAPAASLWKEFEELGIHVRRAEPVFPPRPGYGAEGKACVVRANRFLGRLVDEGLHQYDVTISPEPTPEAEYREVMTKLVSENQHTELGGRFPAYGGRDSLFTAGALPFDTKEFEVTLSAGGDKKMDRKYKVVINHAATISLLQLRMLFAGYPTDIPTQALLVLDTVLRDVVSNERHDIECPAIATKDRTLGVDAWKGLYQSIMSTQNCLCLIADVSSSVFVQPLLLIEVIQKILKMDVVDRNLTKPEYDKLLKVLRGVRIEVTHLGDNRRRKHRIVGLSENPTNDLSFQLSGATMTVIDFFREKYSLELNYKSLPCIIARSEPNPVYLPIEVCKIVPRKCYQKKLEGSQVSPLRKSACIRPELEQSSSHQIVDQEQYKRTKLTTVDARVLLPPNVLPVP